MRRYTEPNLSNSNFDLGFPVHLNEQDVRMTRPFHSEHSGHALYPAQSFPGHWNHLPQAMGQHYGCVRSASTGGYSYGYDLNQAAPSRVVSTREQLAPINYSKSEDALERISPVPFSSIASFPNSSGCEGKTSSERPGPRPRITTPKERKSYRLHLLCRLKTTSISDIQKVLKENPEAARTRAQLKGIESKINGLKKHSLNKGWKRSLYTLPINIAIQNGASLDVLEALVDAAPDVLREPDGPDGESSIHIALKYNIAAQFIDMMLLANPKVAEMVDRQGNTPLHFACLLRPTEFEMIKHLHVLNPQARSHCNMYGRTPLEMMQQTPSNVSEEALDFMQELEIKNVLEEREESI